MTAFRAGPPVPPRTRVAAAAGGAIAALSRRLGQGGGSVIGGRAILALDPQALRRLSRGREVLVVSGTNGKTTTTSLLSAALATRGPVVTNLLGANLPAGITAALAAAPGAATAVLEVDEAWLGEVIDATAAAVAVLLNLSRDQLDRNNEVRRLSSAWRSVLAGRPGVRVVANADDPLVVWAASAAAAVTWVGAGQPWTADAAGCPSCGGRVRFAPDGWACSACDLRRPPLDVRLEGDTVVMASGERLVLDLSLPGRANRANAAMALAAAGHLGVAPGPALAAMAATDQVAGRYRVATVAGIRARLLLAKNPAGWLEVFDLLAPAPAPVVVAINARIADGRDPSWLWDVPFERLRGRLVVASGERSRDLAVRLHYAEVEHRHQPDLGAAIAEAGLAAGGSEAAASDPVEVDAVGNYTSFQQLRALVDHAA